MCGTMNGLIQIANRRHNTEDLIATVMAVEPHGFIYKGRLVHVHVYERKLKEKKCNLIKKCNCIL